MKKIATNVTITPLSPGVKYLPTEPQDTVTENAPLIFIGLYNQDNAFISDDQALYNLLGEPYSPDAINKHLDAHGIEAFIKQTNVSFFDTNVTWQDKNGALKYREELEMLVKKSNRILAGFERPLYYDTDCPGGETYTQLIDNFKQVCRDNKLSTHGFTYHGVPGENRLIVAHNGYGQNTGHGDVFCDISRNPKYRRIRSSYCEMTTREKL